MAMRYTNNVSRSDAETWWRKNKIPLRLCAGINGTQNACTSRIPSVTDAMSWDCRRIQILYSKSASARWPLHLSRLWSHFLEKFSYCSDSWDSYAGTEIVPVLRPQTVIINTLLVVLNSVFTFYERFSPYWPQDWVLSQLDSVE
jgi:hypothetical protein